MRMYTNRYDDALSNCESEVHGFCVWCGSGNTIQKHHPIFRSHGGRDLLVSLCAVCHDKVHRERKLHFRGRYDGSEWVLEGAETGVAASLDKVMEKKIWVPIKTRVGYFERIWA